ncbi:MAG: PAS domain-containing protein [Vitreimonas sp.]
MSTTPITSLASAADTRRREMPVSIALILFTGGIAAAIVEGPGPVGWAAMMSLLLILDTELYNRLDAREFRLDGRSKVALAAWSLACSGFYAVLPAALWLDGQAAGAAAAVVLWVAGVVRQFSPGASGALPVAIAGAAPPALSLLCFPLLVAAVTPQPDWDLAVIAAVGGGALMAYVTQARVSAAGAERALRQRAETASMQHTLAQLVFDNGALAAALVDAEGRVTAISRDMRQDLHLCVGQKFEDAIHWPRERWRDAFARALAGERVRYEEDEAHTPEGARWFTWEASPWRDGSGDICGVIVHGRDITGLVQARAAAAAHEQRLMVALEAGHSVVWEVDYKDRAITWHGDPTPLYGGPIGFAEFMSDNAAAVHEDDRATVQAYFNSVAAGTQGSIEHRVIRSQDEIGWVEIRARRVLGRWGGVRKLIVVSSDATERKRQAAFVDAMSRLEAAPTKTHAVRRSRLPSGRHR